MSLLYTLHPLQNDLTRLLSDWRTAVLIALAFFEAAAKQLVMSKWSRYSILFRKMTPGWFQSHSSLEK